MLATIPDTSFFLRRTDKIEIELLHHANSRVKFFTFSNLRRGEVFLGVFGLADCTVMDLHVDRCVDVGGCEGDEEVC